MKRLKKYVSIAAGGLLVLAVCGYVLVNGVRDEGVEGRASNEATGMWAGKAMSSHESAEARLRALEKLRLIMTAADVPRIINEITESSQGEAVTSVVDACFSVSPIMTLYSLHSCKDEFRSKIIFLQACKRKRDQSALFIDEFLQMPSGSSESILAFSADFILDGGKFGYNIELGDVALVVNKLVKSGGRMAFGRVKGVLIGLHASSIQDLDCVIHFLSLGGNGLSEVSSFISFMQNEIRPESSLMEQDALRYIVSKLERELKENE